MDRGTLKSLLKIIGQQAELIEMLREEIEHVKRVVNYHDEHLADLNAYLSQQQREQHSRTEQLWGGRN